MDFGAQETYEEVLNEVIEATEAVLGYVPRIFSTMVSFKCDLDAKPWEMELIADHLQDSLDIIIDPRYFREMPTVGAAVDYVYSLCSKGMIP